MRLSFPRSPSLVVLGALLLLLPTLPPASARPIIPVEAIPEHHKLSNLRSALPSLGREAKPTALPSDFHPTEADLEYLRPSQIPRPSKFLTLPHRVISIQPLAETAPIWRSFLPPPPTRFSGGINNLHDAEQARTRSENRLNQLLGRYGWLTKQFSVRNLVGSMEGHGPLSLAVSQGIVEAYIKEVSRARTQFNNKRKSPKRYAESIQNLAATFVRELAKTRDLEQVVLNADHLVPRRNDGERNALSTLHARLLNRREWIHRAQQQLDTVVKTYTQDTGDAALSLGARKTNWQNFAQLGYFEPMAQADESGRVELKVVEPVAGLDQGYDAEA